MAKTVMLGNNKSIRYDFGGDEPAECKKCGWSGTAKDTLKGEDCALVASALSLGVLRGCAHRCPECNGFIEYEWLI